MKWISNLRESNRLLIAASSAMTAVASAAVTYVVTNRVLEKKFQERLKRETDDARAYFQELYSTPTLTKEDIRPTQSEGEISVMVREATAEIDGMPADLVEKAIEAVRKYEGAPDEETTEEDISPRIVNLFQSHTAPGEEVLAALMADRDPSQPYIITKEEFLNNDPDHEQLKFTYWSGDGVLVDDREEMNPVDNERVAGEDNLLRFGYGSGDEHVLYVRNEALELDLHITRSTGKYTVEVMAFDDDGPHLAHSRSPRKFRNFDD